jgi:hypothetical protein
MNTLIKLSIALFSVVTVAADKSEYESCECPKVECPACMRADGITFVSQKCGENGSKTRSCSQPKCVENLTADGKCAKRPVPVATTPAGESAKTTTGDAATSKVIGAVKVVKGSVQIVGADGKPKAVVQGQEIHEHDGIVTGNDAGTVLDLEGGNRVHVLEASKVNIQEYNSSEESKKAVFNLLRGKIRNQVKEKYNSKTSRYQVVTPGVVAGVRGTDFVISHEETDHGVTRVETIEGTVQLAERAGDKEATVKKGEAVTYVIDDLEKRGDSEWSSLAQKGSFNPVYKLTSAQLAQLDKTSRLAPDSAVAAIPASKKVERSICKGPSGKLNQCAWKCLNNPKGSKTCQVEQSGVSCVRTRCNANGEWSEETRLPAAAGRACSAEGTVVDSCDY